MSIFRDGAITIAVSSDKLRALLSISATKADYPSDAKILSALSLAGINYGIDKSLVLSISSEKEQISEVTIAEASAVQSGTDAQLVWNVNIDGKKPVISTDGRADMKNLNHFELVEAGTILVTKVLPKESTNGILVTGEYVDAPDQVNDLSMPLGNNVSLSEDGLSIIADIRGHASLKHGLIDVDTVYHLNSDVDMKTGNINYDGVIMIEGDVRSGFRVEASESIYINGSVEAAEVYSRNGSIFIKRGILGRNQARILAREELRCGFIQDATASARNNIIIDHYALNSQITSGGVIRIIDNEGLLRGGKLVADIGIEVLEAGSQRNMHTEMVLSQSDHNSGNETLLKKQSEVTEKEHVIISLKRRKQFLELLQKHLNKISDQRAKELLEISKQIKDGRDQIEKLKQNMELIRIEEAKKSQNYAITVHNKLYRKVIFTIGYKQYINEAVRSGVSVQKKGDELQISPLV